VGGGDAEILMRVIGMDEEHALALVTSYSTPSCRGFTSKGLASGSLAGIR
jgi:hypothetical protein